MDLSKITYTGDSQTSEHELQGPYASPLRFTKDSEAKSSLSSKPPLKKCAHMDLSEITYTGDSHSREHELQSPYVTPLHFTKDSEAKSSLSSTTPQKKCAPMAVTYKIHVTEFRSMVQRLTGFSPNATSPLIEEAQPILFNEGIAREIRAYDNMQQCLKWAETLAGRPKDVWAECLDCLAYCTLFPNGYEIEGDMLVQLWMAAGLVGDEPMEDIAAAYLTALDDFGDIVSLSRLDHATGKDWYKVNNSSKLISQTVLNMSRISLVRVESDDPISVLSAKKEPYHVMFWRHYLPINLGVLGSLTHIRTLLLPRIRLCGNQEANIDRLPYDFFMSLKLIQALDLSGTKVSEVPSSIGNAKWLRFLDLSETLIKRLPETMDCLQSLQTLKLRNCLRLIALPKGMRKLTGLRHLDLGTLCRRLHSMPPGMGALSSLWTLSEFVAGRENGCQIRELKNMINLSGKLCLSRLDHVASLEEAKEADLSNKQRLTKLDLRWTDDTERASIGDDHQVIEHLRPPTNLQDLRILCYGGSTFPSWVSDPSFDELLSVTLFKCENCKLLPSLGQLPSLQSLTLIEMVGVTTIDSLFCRSDTATGDKVHFVAFPVLQKLEVRSMVNLEEWKDVGQQDFPQLTKFTIKDCPALTTLCRISNLHSLEHLEINRCHQLPCLPEGDLPASLITLVIEDCPLLCLRSLMEDAKDWHKTKHSPNLFIYQRDEESQGGGGDASSAR